MQWLKSTRLYIGCDLGQIADYTALVILQHDEGSPYHYCPWAERFPLRTDYPAIVDLVASRVRSLAEWLPYLVVDCTGPGLAVTDLMKQRGLQLTAVNITSGFEVSEGAKSLHIPKRELVGGLSVALQTGKLKIASGMRHAEDLRRELLDFQVRYGRAGHERYEARRSAVHDDLCIALMLALWKLRKHEEGGVIHGLYEHLREQAETRT